MRLKPHANAFNMKPMIAFRQKSRLFTFRDFGKTNRTLQSIFEILGIKWNCGNGCKDGRVKASAVGIHFLITASKVGPTTSAPPCPAVAGVFLPVAGEIFRVYVKEEYQDNHKEEKCDDSHHDLSSERNHT